MQKWSKIGVFVVAALLVAAAATGVVLSLTKENAVANNVTFDSAGKYSLDSYDKGKLTVELRSDDVSLFSNDAKFGEVIINANGKGVILNNINADKIVLNNAKSIAYGGASVKNAELRGSENLTFDLRDGADIDNIFSIDVYSLTINGGTFDYYLFNSAMDDSINAVDGTRICVPDNGKVHINSLNSNIHSYLDNAEISIDAPSKLFIETNAKTVVLNDECEVTLNGNTVGLLDVNAHCTLMDDGKVDRIYYSASDLTCKGNVVSSNGRLYTADDISFMFFFNNSSGSGASVVSDDNNSDPADLAIPLVFGEDDNNSGNNSKFPIFGSMTN